MTRRLGIITLGKILAEIEKEGRDQGKEEGEWLVQRLYVTRGELSPENIKAELIKLQQKNPKATEKDARERLFFPAPRKTLSGRWRIYTREEANDLKQKIKERKGWL